MRLTVLVMDSEYSTFERCASLLSETETAQFNLSFAANERAARSRIDGALPDCAIFGRFTTEAEDRDLIARFQQLFPHMPIVRLPAADNTSESVPSSAGSGEAARLHRAVVKAIEAAGLERPKAGDLTSLNILVIDDNIDDREALRRTLERITDIPINCVESENGRDALNIIATQPLDCVLLDYSLPGWNGIEVLRRLRALNPDIPVIILTGQGNETVAVQAMKEGAQDYITKGNINPNSLRRIISTAIEHSLLNRHIHKQQEKIRQQQKALSETTLLNAAILDSAPCMIIATDSHGAIRTFNRAAEKLTGYDGTEVIGHRTLADLCEPAALRALAAQLSEEIGRVVPADFSAILLGSQSGLQPKELEFRRRDGRRFPVHISVTDFSDQLGGVASHIAIIDDITLRKEQEAAVRQSEEVLRLSMAGAPAGIALIDPRMRWISVNPALCQLLGIEAGRLRRTPFTSVVHPGDLGAIYDDLDALLKGKHDSLQKERRFMHQSGQLIWAIFSVSLIRYDDGRPRHFIIQVMDITERKEMDRLKSEFISVVSHELRTPLTSIRGSLGLLQATAGPNLPPMATELIRVSNRNCERLMSLVNDILDIDKISSGEMRYDMRLETVGRLVDQLLDANRGYAERFNVTLGASHEDAAAMVRTDGERLVQVLTNLVSNAAKFSPADGQVEIATTMTDLAVRFSVIDRGSGIPAEYEPRMFTRFAQADSSNARKKNGTGLGLYIAKQMTEHMGGTIGYHRTEGGGATFWIEMPRVATTGDDEQSANGDGQHAKSHLPTVLHVEDDKDLSDILIGALVGKASVISAGTCAEASALLSEREFDIVLLDAVLPDGNGLDLLKIHKFAPKTRLVIWSGQPAMVHGNVGPDIPVFAKDENPLPSIVREIAAMV